MGYCHKHGVFSTFCRGCDLDIIEEDEMRREKNKLYHYHFQQRVKFQIKQKQDPDVVLAGPVEYIFQWGADKDSSLMLMPVGQIKNELRRVSERYIKSNITRWVSKRSNQVLIDIQECDFVGIPGFLTDHDIRPVLVDLLK